MTGREKPLLEPIFPPWNLQLQLELKPPTDWALVL